MDTIHRGSNKERDDVMVNPLFDRAVCELMLSNYKLGDFWDQGAWEEINRRMFEEHVRLIFSLLCDNPWEMR